MRDFRDAKAMAQKLRDSLITKSITISHSESLEFVSKMLGVADWNTLSALLQSDRRDAVISSTKHPPEAVSSPAIPLRDLVPFPTMIYPLFVGREKTKPALREAFERHREVVLAIQKDPAVDEPGFDDVYEIGVLAQLLEVERLPDSTLKVLVQVNRRVVIRRFIKDAGGFQAEFSDVNEGPIPDASDLIQKTVKRFENYAATREIGMPQTRPPLDQIRDPGRVADIISTHVTLPISLKHRLLATLDPVIRLKQIEALLGGAPSFSSTFTATRSRALGYANARKHQYATLEHLLLALIDDDYASAVLRNCNTDLNALKANLLRHLDNDLKELVIENGAEAKPTPAFQRVLQRAALNAQEMERPSITGTNALLAIFPETRSSAVQFLAAQGISRGRAAAAAFGAEGTDQGG